MSRAYRISVKESVHRVIKAEDSVCTQLEVLEVLPPEQMAGLLADELEKRGFKKAELQGQVTDRLEGKLSDLRQELDQVVNRVTAEALKRKAESLGRIKELTEDQQTGSMTIVVEV